MASVLKVQLCPGVGFKVDLAYRSQPSFGSFLFKILRFPSILELTERHCGVHLRPASMLDEELQSAFDESGQFGQRCEAFGCLQSCFRA